MRRQVLSVALGVVLATAVSYAGAQGLGDRYSIFGGKPLRSGQSAIAGGLGYPSILGQYEMSMGDSFGLGFRGEVLYGYPYFGAFGGFGGFGGFVGYGAGFGFGVPMRLAMGSSSKTDMALSLMPFLQWFPGQTWACGFGVTCSTALFAVGFEPGFVVNINLGRTKPIAVLVGGASPITMVFASFGNTGVTYVVFPILAQGGVEIQVTQGLNVGGLVRLGPSIPINAPAGAFVPFHFSGMATVEYLFR